MIIRLQDVNEFYRSFFGVRITLEQVDQVFKTWLTCYKDDPDGFCLRFTTADDRESVFWPKRIVDIVRMSKPDGALLEARVQILNNISDPWTCVFPSEQLPGFLKDFFWISDSEEDFWVTIGSYRPQFVDYAQLSNL